MIVSSQYSRSFYSDRLTSRKYQALKAHGESLLAVRNELSVLVNSDLLDYQQMSRIDFQKKMLPLIKDRVHSNFTKQLCDDVLKSYQNRFTAISKHMRFEKVTKLERAFYKRATGDKKKGDPKGFDRRTESTPLTKVLSFLARYGNEGTLLYVSSAILTETVESKRKFYAQVLDYSNRFGFERLMRLALSKRTQVLDRYKNPVCFQSLTFRGRSRLSSDIVSYNNNFRSVIKAFVTFSWTEAGTSFKIPVRYSKKFHGDMKKYTNGTDTSYTLCISPVSKEVRIILSHKGDREYPDASPGDSFVGFDVNSKHNQLVGSNGIVVDHDRKSLDALVKELLHTDKLKSLDKDYQPGKKRYQKIETLRRKIKHHTERNCVSICKHMVTKGEHHAVFEDLGNGFGRCFIKTADDLNYNRLVKEMHLSSIKDEFEHIARKYKVSCSTVHAEYTSQECHECGCIGDGNRKTQEEFECLECGHKDNADSNSSKNIGRRVSEAVLRDALLCASKLGNGSYSPRTLHRHKVKEMLLSLRYKVYSIRPRDAGKIVC